MEGFLVLCCALPLAWLAALLGGFACLIVAEQRDGHRGWQFAGWLCIGVCGVGAWWLATVAASSIW